MNSRITVEEIRVDLNLGRLAVVKLLEEKEIPGIRNGTRWLVTRRAYEQWKRTCGMRTEPQLRAV